MVDEKPAKQMTLPHHARLLAAAASASLSVSAKRASVARDTGRTQLEPRYVRPNEAARLLGVSRSKLYLAIKAGTIPVTRWGGCTLIAVSDLHPPMEAA